MVINIITLFPGMFSGVIQESIIGRAQEQGIVDIRLIDLRPFGLGAHHVVDDAPYGGGGGMVMKPEPIAAAIEELGDAAGHVILTTPRGRVFRQDDALRLREKESITILCGHYEGVDERVSELFVHEELSIGDYVLTGGEVPAMVIADSVVRLLPGALGCDTLETGDSHYNGLLEHPQYTRPRDFRGHEVPEVLLSGNHEHIRKWRREQSLKKTGEQRPDLYEMFVRSGEGD